MAAWIEFEAYDGCSFAVPAEAIYLVMRRKDTDREGGSLIGFVPPGTRETKALITSEDYASVLKRLRDVGR